MKIARALLLLLLCIALPWSAMANMAQGMQCHHDGLGGLAETAQHQHSADVANNHHHHHSAAAADEDRGCDCDVKCSCSHHCASGCSVAAIDATTPLQAYPAGTDGVSTAGAAMVPDARNRSFFRPPIPALTSAA